MVEIMKKLVTYFITILIIMCTGNAFGTTVTLATMNWQPFYGENLQEGGFFTALSREAFKRAGYELKVVFVPWKRAVEQAKNGHYDGLLGAYFIDERTEYFNFTDSIAKNEEFFIQRKGGGITYAQIEDLKKYTIGGIRGGVQVSELIQKGFNIDVATDEIGNIKKLNAKRVDLIIMGKQQLHYLLRNNEELKQSKREVQFLIPPFKTYDLFNTITKKIVGGEDIVRKFNKALKDMRADGSYDKILKRFGQI